MISRNNLYDNAENEVYLYSIMISFPEKLNCNFPLIRYLGTSSRLFQMPPPLLESYSVDFNFVL
jgi:hypothetical protein